MLVWNCYLLSNHGSCPPPTPSGSLTFPQAPQAHATVSGEEKQLDLWDPSPSCHLLWGKEREYGCSTACYQIVCFSESPKMMPPWAG